MDQKTRQQYIDQFISKCRRIGLSVTPQRLMIYKAVIDDNSHPSPDSVYKKIHAEIPTISLATVYKTLETFAKHGMISQVTALHNTVRYDPVTHRHHHMICVSCKKVTDIEDPALDEIPVPDSVLQDNQLVDISVHFNVICTECRDK